MKLWLTKCHGGRHMLTKLRPTIARIRGTEIMDAFEHVGEPIAVKHLCEPGIRALLGVDLAPLTPTKIDLNAKVIQSLEDYNDPRL